MLQVFLQFITILARNTSLTQVRDKAKFLRSSTHSNSSKLSLLVKTIEVEQDPQTFGFRRGRSTREPILLLRFIGEKRIRKDFCAIMSLGVIKQEEYLKKYLDKKSTSKGKKKKKKISSKLHGFSVVDESVDLKDLPFGGEENDYAPTVAEVTYEDEKAKLIEEFQANKNKWKSFNSNEIDEHEIKIEENEIGLFSVENKIKSNTLSLSSMSGSVTDSVKSEQPSNSNSRHDSTRERDDSDTPPSRSKRHDSDLSPPYRKRHDSDSSPTCKKRHSPHTSPSRRKRYDNVTSTHQKMHDSNSSPRRKTHSDDTSSLRKRRHDSDTLSYRRNRYDSDTSPTSSPRRCRNDSDTSHLRRKRHDSDTSLPEQKINDSCKSPPRMKKHDSKISPSRRKKCHLNMSPRRKHCDSDTSPPRKRNDSDTSPPRRRKDESDTSPSRRRNYSDTSPPRKRKYDFGRSTPQRRNDSDTSPPRRRKDDSDTSPPRRRRNDSDTSPPRRRRNDSDTSPPRRRKDGSDFSPPRRKRHGDSITSTSSRIKHNFGSLHHLERCDKDASQVGAPKKDNISSEYPTDSSLSSFSKLKRGEHFKAASFKKIKSKVPKELSEEEKVLARKLEEKYQKWNKGVVQDQKHKEAADYVLHEMGKSFARTADDEDMNRSLKNVMRQEDPMLEYIARKEAKRNIQPLKPRYVGSFPANRFNIAPGYRWDGVDRSNGYEKEWFIKKSSKRATEDESYKWSTEDM